MSPELLLVALLVTKVGILLETSQCWSIIIILGFLFYFRISAVCQFLGAAQETLDLSDHEYEVDDITYKGNTEQRKFEHLFYYPRIQGSLWWGRQRIRCQIVDKFGWLFCQLGFELSLWLSWVGAVDVVENMCPIERSGRESNIKSFR